MVRWGGVRRASRRAAVGVSVALAVAVAVPSAHAEDPVATDTPTSEPSPTTATDPTTPPEPTSSPEPTSATTAPAPSPVTTSTGSTSTSTSPRGTSSGGTGSGSSPSTGGSGGGDWSGTGWVGPTAPTWAPGDYEPDHDKPLSGTFLRSQIAEAARISAILESSNTEVAKAMRKMNKLSSKSNALLEALVEAKEVERAASQEADDARAELERLEVRLASARAILQNWVFDVYAGGGGDSDLTGMLEALQNEPDEVGDPLGDLSYLTEQRALALQDVRVLTAEQKRLEVAAEEAHDAATEARRTLQSDKKALDKVMSRQRDTVDELRELQMDEVDKAGSIASVLVGARTPEAKAAAQRLREALKGSIGDIEDFGKPCSEDDGVYANGRLPSRALCPVWGADGEFLSPTAATSFSALSKAYAAQTGTPLCITDSYRSYAEQVAVKASRGAWAATPGTSRHGEGMAVDLCGGIQSFGSAAHLWMRQNAPLYGWYHPSWAAAGGSKPEPWHWEFAG